MHALYVAQSIHFSLEEKDCTEAHRAISIISDDYLIECSYHRVFNWELKIHSDYTGKGIQELGKSNNILSLDKDDLFYILRSLIEERIGDSAAVVIGDEKNRTLSLHFSPRNLRAALWQQFAQVMTGSLHLQRCEGCRSIYSNRGHRDRRFCSGKCQKRVRRAG